MTSNRNSTLKVAGAGLALALTVGACAELMPIADHYVPPPLGSHWVYTQHDTGSYGSGTKAVSQQRGERIWHGEKLLSFTYTGGAVLARPDGAWVTIVSAGDKPLLSWNPPVNWEYPLEVGKSWTKSTSLTMHAAKRTIPYSYTGKVETYEDVTVPAGTFKAFRVHATNTLGEDHTRWFSPQLGIFVKSHLVRTSKYARGPGTRDVELVSQDIVK